MRATGLTIGVVLALVLAPGATAKPGRMPVAGPGAGGVQPSAVGANVDSRAGSGPMVAVLAADVDRRAWAMVDAPYAGLVWQAAEEWGLSPWLLLGLLWVESGLQAHKVNKTSGAAGLGQFTATGIRGLNRIRMLRGSDTTFDRAAALDPEAAVPASAELLAWLVVRFGVQGGVMSYNGGPARRSFMFQVLRRTDYYRTRAGLPPGRYTCEHARCRTARKLRPAS